MSSMGTGPAAAAAQAALNAQQVGRAKAKARFDRSAVAADHEDRFVKQLEATAEADDLGGELPDRQAPAYEALYDGVIVNPHGCADCGGDHDEGAGCEPPFHHIDVQG